ncbi:uncharacterized protein LOC132172558 isoform X2 [Corylus avellana]|uniref:uncharacterized protein LOC132172558 isoform X2 n=1 Tax=Corylus avellana TaxID=13451 RepID=UPI00286B3FBC|nr:uncharacterized protein LOC132172558 isoform X2 [Corylus avellana]
MEEVEKVLGRNSLEDDMLISLKLLLLQHAKASGHGNLAENFDLKMLRALGFILMECLKEKVKNLSLAPDGSAAFMDCCNLLKCNVEKIMSIEELKACIDPNSVKSLAKRQRKGVAPNKRNFLPKKRKVRGISQLQSITKADQVKKKGSARGVH